MSNFCVRKVQVHGSRAPAGKCRHLAVPFPLWSPTEPPGCSSVSLRVTWHFQRDARTLRALPDQRHTPSGSSADRRGVSRCWATDSRREEASCPASVGPKLPEKRSSCSAHLPTWLLPPQVTARSRQVHFRNGREKARARSAPLGLTDRFSSTLSG